MLSAARPLPNHPGTKLATALFTAAKAVKYRKEKKNLNRKPPNKAIRKATLV